MDAQHEDQHAVIDEKLILVIGAHQVLSELVYDDSHPEVTLVRIHSSCDGHIAHNVLTIKHRLGYSDAQAVSDITAARWKYAEALAGKKDVRSRIPALIRAVSGNPKVTSERP